MTSRREFLKWSALGLALLAQSVGVAGEAARYQAEGHDVVAEANGFREKKDFAGGEDFLKRQETLAVAATNLEQRQSVLMARFALYRAEAARRDEMIALLKRVKEMGTETFWGVAAVGWLDWWGVEKAPMRRPAENPCRARGMSGQTNTISRARASESNIVVTYLRELVGEPALAEIAVREGGGVFLKCFFGDVAWMESFAGSGPWYCKHERDKKDKRSDGELAAASLKALDLLCWNDEDGFIGTPLGRNIATALALDHGWDWDDAKLVAVMRDYRRWAKDGSLIPECRDQDVHAWREVLGFGQNAKIPEENLVWMHDVVPLESPSDYKKTCWRCTWRRCNCFGLSVHGPDYYRPWEHAWCLQECRYRVGGVCGALSKFGSGGAQAHGVRSFTAGQPEHCAYVVWDYAKSRWSIAYDVTHRTDPHFTLGGRGFAALEEQERYFAHPQRMEAERLRWQGRYEESVRRVPGNWQAADEWRRKLAADPQTGAADWQRYGAAVLAGFATAPSEGWNLYLTCIDHLPNTNAFAAVEKGLRGLRENTAETDERAYLDDIALNPLASRFKNQPEAVWKIFETALTATARSPSFYRQTIDWGAARYMKEDASSQRFLALVAKSAEATGEKLDFAEMVRKASQSGDPALFAQVFGLARRIAPDLLPKAKGKCWPREDFGGTLVGEDALVATSSQSRHWDKPLRYAALVEASDADYDKAFHTNEEKAPWVTVRLKGETEVTGLLVVNAGGGIYRKRQVPMKAWWSEDGKEWREAWSAEENADEWRVPFPPGTKARFVRVGRAPGAKNDYFHLHKVLVYGRKLY